MNDNSEKKEMTEDSAIDKSSADIEEPTELAAIESVDYESVNTQINTENIASQPLPETQKNNFIEQSATAQNEKIIKNTPDLFAEESYYNNNPLPQNNPMYAQVPMSKNGQIINQTAQANNIPYQNQGFNQPIHPADPQQQFNQQNLYGTIPPNNTSQLPPETKKKHTGLVIGLIITAIIIIIVFGLLLVAKGFKDIINTPSASESENIPAETEFSISQTPENENALIKDSEGRLTTEGVAEKASPSVVGVLGKSAAYQKQGSGIILSEDGYVITNAHIIEDCSTVSIILDEENQYPATIIGSNVAADIAVLKFTPDTAIVSAELGESSKLKIGEQVITIGNPRGLWGTFTGGYVSGIRDLSIDDSENKITYIQTDAPVNYGNSGGPLLNMYGQVVGIVSSKYVYDDAEGLGFAIAIDDALPIVEGIIKNQKVMGSVKIGITYAVISKSDAEALGVKPGFYVNDISPDCDIANTDLRKGDIITHINGVRVYSSADIANAIGNKKPGDTATIKAYRKSTIGEEESFEIEFKLMEK